MKIKKSIACFFILIVLSTYGMKVPPAQTLYTAILDDLHEAINNDEINIGELSPELQDTYLNYTREHLPPNWKVLQDILYKKKGKLVYYPAATFGNLSRGTRLTIVAGDIVKQKVNAIVNAANVNLAHGGGVAKAIADAAGAEMQSYCNTITLDADGERCKVGNAVVTDAFNLRKNGIKKIIHAVGPNCKVPQQENNFQALLADAYKNSLNLAKQYDIKSIAFPSISTAIFACPLEEASEVACRTIINYIKENPNDFNEIRFVLRGDTYSEFEDCIEKLLWSKK